MPIFDKDPSGLQQHASEEEILLYLDGELTPKKAATVQAHLRACWQCRTLLADTGAAIAGFMDLYQPLPDGVDGSDARAAASLRRRLRQSAEENAQVKGRSLPGLLVHWRSALVALAVLAVVGISVFLTVVNGARGRFHSEAVLAGIEPKPALTPGETVGLSRSQVCSGEYKRSNAVLSSDLAESVLQRYGLTSNRRDDFELDYLITPDLGGAPTVRNIWPEPYRNTIWNAHVKDELEDRLRVMVCSGDLDLRTAQHEMASDWIRSYRNRFRSDMPLLAGGPNPFLVAKLQILKPTF